MFDEFSVFHIRRFVHVIQRSTFKEAYCFSCSEKTKRASPLRNERQYRLFQIIYASFTFPILPISICQSVMVTMEEGQHAKLTMILAYTFTLFIWTFVPYTWVLSRYSGISKFIHVLEATSNMDKQFTGVQIYII